MKTTTTKPAYTGIPVGDSPEFGRATDLQKIFGLRRGTIYNLLRAGRIRGCLLRVKGKKSGVRLFDIQSVRQFIINQMQEGE
jgi:hypothetical protein